MPRARTPRQRDLNGAVPRNQAEVQSLAWVAALAVLGAVIGSAIGYRLNRTSAAIMGPVGAAVATARYSSFIGEVLGAPIGLLAALLGPRRFAMVALSCALSLAIGAIAGAAAGSLAPVEVSPDGWAATASVAAILVIALNAAVVRLESRSGGRQMKSRWRTISGRLTLAAVTLAAAVAAIPVGITLESVYRVAQSGRQRGNDLAAPRRTLPHSRIVRR